MSRTWRNVLVWLHIVSSVGWMGQAAALCALLVTAHPDAAKLLDETILVASANMSAFTGFALAAVTTWGYFLHWWVAIKFVVTISQLYVGIFVLSPAMEEGEPSLGYAAALMATALALQVWLSVSKPFGRTPLARRTRKIPLAAPVWVYAICVAAPLLDLGTLILTGDPTPIMSLLTLVIVLVARRYRRIAAVGRTEQSHTGVLRRAEAVASGVKVLHIGCDTVDWEPGAHIDVAIGDGPVRQYSLVGGDRHGYEIAVLRDGAVSTRLHGLQVGEKVRIGGPRNNFPLVDAPAYLFVAGGIGISPFLSMLERTDRPWQLVYRGRSRATMPYADDLEARYGSKVLVLPSDTTPRPDLRALVAAQPEGAAVYCCGPDSLLAAVTDVWPATRVERFTPTDRTALPSEPFDVYLAHSRATVHVGAGVSTLDALRSVRPDLPAACENGLCGSCALNISLGQPEHRDDILADRSRADLFYPCVSRAAGACLVVDA